MIFQQHTVAPGGAVYAINAAAIFCYKISGAGAASGSGEFSKAAQRTGGDRNLCGSAGGGQECAGKDYRHNLRLVAHVAKKYYAQPGDQEDLISIGTIGLMKAVDTFDTTRKARFATYASRCIGNELRMHFRRERRNGVVVSLQEHWKRGRRTARCTLSDVLQDGFCMEPCLPSQDEALRHHRADGLPARESRS